jgi:hypothetical protein
MRKLREDPFSIGVLLWLLLVWAFSNFLWDWLTHYLEAWGLKEADLIASISNLILPALAAGFLVYAAYHIGRHVSAPIGTPKVNRTYLRSADADLGPAIIEMAHNSAWGRWFAARHLVQSGQPFSGLA